MIFLLVGLGCIEITSHFTLNFSALRVTNHKSQPIHISLGVFSVWVVRFVVSGEGLLVSHNLDLWWWVILFSVYCLWVLLPEIRLPCLADWLATAAWVWLWLFCFSWESPLIGLLGNRDLFGNGDVGYLSKLPLIMENIKACSRISDQNELPIY